MEALATLPRGLPPYSIGYGVAQWCQQHLQQPDGPDAGQPWRFTDEQLRFLLWWYAVQADGLWVFRRGVLRRAKGWGKDPLSAVVSLAELMGPVRFLDLGAEGIARGQAHSAPLVQVGAVRQDQTKNTTDLMPALLPEGTRRKYHMEVQKELVYARTPTGGRGRLEAVTNSYRGQEGARTTMFILNETQHWISSNGGHNMAAVVRRNLAKSRDGSARALSLTNAHGPGEDSQAERDYEAYMAQQADGYDGQRDILYDNLEPLLPEDFDLANREQRIEAMQVAYGESDWVSLERLAAEYDDPAVSDGEVQRFYLNRIVAGQGQWMDPAGWDAAVRQDFKPEEGAQISLGFDGSRTRDATVLVATDLRSGHQWVVQAWERDWLEPDWEVPSAEVNEAVARVHETFRVERFYCDPPFWEDEVAAWCGRYEHAAYWYTSGNNAVRVARALFAFRQAVYERLCTHGGDPMYRRHALAAVEREIGGRAGEEDDLVTISKKSKDSRECIDAAMAGMLSWQARLDAIADGALEDEEVDFWIG